MKKFTIRRHLSKGQYFGFFQVRGYITDSKQGEVLFYVNPETQNLVMQDCILHNKVNQSIKIFEGQNKRPCAYIICGKVEVKDATRVEGIKVSYNPKKSPNWTINNKPSNFAKVNKIETFGTKLFRLS